MSHMRAWIAYLHLTDLLKKSYEHDWLINKSYDLLSSIRPDDLKAIWMCVMNAERYLFFTAISTTIMAHWTQADTKMVMNISPPKSKTTPSAGYYLSIMFCIVNSNNLLFSKMLSTSSRRNNHAISATTINLT
jgi:hypothetical protein